MLRRTVCSHLRRPRQLPLSPSRRLVRYAAKDAPKAAHEPESQQELGPDTLLSVYTARSGPNSLPLLRALRPHNLGDSLSDRLQSAGIPKAEYDTWKHAVVAPSLADALDAAQQILKEKQSDSADSDPAGNQGILPPWTLLALLRKPPLSEMEAFVVHRLTISHRISSDPQLIPLLFVLSAHWLVQLRMHGPLRSLYLHVAKESEQLPPIHVALLLRVLSQGQATSDLHKMITGLLNIALRRHLELDTDVYRDVLNSPAADHGIALLVERHMRQHKFMPNLAHSRALIRIYGRSGRQVQASRYWRRLTRGHFHGKVPMYVHRKGFQASILADYIKAFRIAGQAERFLRYLLKRSIRTKEKGEASSVAAAPGLSNTNDLPPRVWVQIIRVMSKDRQFSTSRLLAVLEDGKNHALSPVADLYHSVGFGLDADSPADGGSHVPILSPEDEDGRTYFGIVPHDPLFRALLDLLAEEDRAGEVPRVLAWMRHLAVTPSKATLATALVYWAEVGLGGPLIERWVGEGGSAYDGLVRWMEEWVGRERVPGAEEMQATFRRVQFFREMQGLGGAARDLTEEEDR
ncbi:hypothetical protein FKP32DRAFT_1605547 [Trametes sanguinea]|nr:hypothetical protein FKP32DRAFT_1605547 [Trametes sanguinea]